MRFHLLFILSLLSVFSVSAQLLSPTEKKMEKMGLVDLKKADKTLWIDLMYTRADNFTGKVLYTDLKRAYLHPEAAKALLKAQQILKKSRPDLSLKIYDAARPMHVQSKMWNTVVGTSKSIYVSNPKNGGGLHNYGLAIDVTLCHAQTGDTLHMGTVIDHLGKAAHVDQERRYLQMGILQKEAIRNRQLLRKIMTAAGFKVLRTEWWHFNFKSRTEAKSHYQVIP